MNIKEWCKHLRDTQWNNPTPSISTFRYLIEEVERLHEFPEENERLKKEIEQLKLCPHPQRSEGE